MFTSITITVASMAAGRVGTGAVAKGSYLILKLESKKELTGNDVLDFGTSKVHP